MTTNSNSFIILNSFQGRKLYITFMNELHRYSTLDNREKHIIQHNKSSHNFSSPVETKALKNELKTVITSLVGFKRKPQSKQAVHLSSFLKVWES